MARVVRAHDALQFGEFAHHVGQQIGLGQQGAAFGQGHVVVQFGGDGAGQRLDALCAGSLRAQLVVVDDVGQQRQTRCQRLLLVLLEEELGVGQARAHDALVAADDVFWRVRLDVGDDQEARAQLAFAVGQGEVFLVRLHGEDQAFLRHGQEFLLEVAFIHDRPFDQGRHFVEQRFGHQHLVGAGLVQQLGADALLAFLVAGDDAGVEDQRRRIVFRVRDGDRFAIGEETVAQGGAAGGEAQQGQGQDIDAVQGDQAVGRAHELHGGAVRALIAHQFWNRQLGAGLAQSGLRAGGKLAARRRVGVEEAFGLAVGGAFQLGHRQVGEAQRGQFLGQRRRAVAVRVQRHGDGQDFFADRFVGRDFAHVGDGDGQAARRGVAGGDAVGFEEVARFQAVDDAGREGGAQFGQRFRRQFFGQQFDEQCLVHGVLVWYGGV